MSQSFENQKTRDAKQAVWDKLRLESQQNRQTTTASNNSDASNFGDLLNQQKSIWDTTYDQRQKEAETNAERAFRYRGFEANRQFGFDKDVSKQTFEQDRTIQGDSIASQEKRQQAQFQAQERMAGLNQQLKQRQQESERTAALSAFRGNRR
jgi:hypothetical protein